MSHESIKLGRICQGGLWGRTCTLRKGWLRHGGLPAVLFASVCRHGCELTLCLAHHGIEGWYGRTGLLMA